MQQQRFPTALVGPSAVLREGIARILAEADFPIVASARCLADVDLSLLPQDGSMLLLISTGDDADWTIRQIKAFRQTHAGGRVAVVTNQCRLRDMYLTYRAGANICFTEVATCTVFVKSLELVMLGETILPPELLSCIDDGADDEQHHAIPDVSNSVIDDREFEHNGAVPRLSNRERCILHCIVEGGSNKVIARKMDIAEATVKVHVKAILRKIRAHNRTQAAIWALNNSSVLGLAAIDASNAKMALPPPPAPGGEVEPARLAASIQRGNGRRQGQRQDLLSAHAPG